MNPPFHKPSETPEHFLQRYNYVLCVRHYQRCVENNRGKHINKTYLIYFLFSNSTFHPQRNCMRHSSGILKTTETKRKVSEISLVQVLPQAVKWWIWRWPCLCHIGFPPHHATHSKLRIVVCNIVLAVNNNANMQYRSNHSQMQIAIKANNETHYTV